MSYIDMIKDNEVDLRLSDEALIFRKLRMTPNRFKDDLVFGYIRAYHEALNRESINNVARVSIARHDANRYLKLYRINWNE